MIRFEDVTITYPDALLPTLGVLIALLPAWGTPRQTTGVYAA